MRGSRSAAQTPILSPQSNEAPVHHVRAAPQTSPSQRTVAPAFQRRATHQNVQCLFYSLVLAMTMMTQVLGVIFALLVAHRLRPLPIAHFEGYDLQKAA